MEVKSFVKETELLRKQLTNHLNSFDKNVEWADYSNWLIRVAQILEENRTPFIPDRSNLAKRLAQCLYSSLPAKVHGEALVVYAKLFENMRLLDRCDLTSSNYSMNSNNIAFNSTTSLVTSSCNNGNNTQTTNNAAAAAATINQMGMSNSMIRSRNVSANNPMVSRYVDRMSQDLHYYALGLFPFFQFASLQTKKQFISILNDYVLELKMELIPCLPALVACVMPGLEANDEEIQRMTATFLDALKEGVGEKHFFASLWMSILRVNRIRSASFKYLSRKRKSSLQNSPSIDLACESGEVSKDVLTQIGSKVDFNKVESSSPDKGESVGIAATEINECSGGTEGNQAANATTTTRAGSNSPAAATTTRTTSNNLESKQELQNYLLSQIQKGLHFKNEVHLHPNRESLIINALLSVLYDSDQLTRRACLDYLISNFPITEGVLSTTEKQLLVQQCMHLMHLNEYNIIRRINTWFFGPPDVENNFSISLEEEQGRQIIKYITTAIVNLFEIQHQDKTIPLKVVQTFYRENDHFIQPTLSDISFEMINFMNDNKLDQALVVSIERLLQSISNHLNIVLKRLNQKLSEAMSKLDEEGTLKAIELIEYTIFQRPEEESPIDDSVISSSIKLIISEILAIFVKNGAKTITCTAFKVPALNIVHQLLIRLKVQNQTMDVTEEQKETISNFGAYLCDYIAHILDLGEDDGVLDSSVKIMIMLHRYARIQEINKLPDWLDWLMKCLSSHSTKIRYFAVQNLSELIVHDSEFKELLVKNEDTLRSVLKCLYSILDEESLSSSSVIDSLLHFNFSFPNLFREFIEQDLKEKSNIDGTIRRFSKFFRLTNSHFKASPSPLSSTGVYQVLAYLSDENPLVRFTARSWLNDNLGFIERVLDPLMRDLVKELNRGEYHLEVEEEKVVFRKQYDSDKVLEIYKLLKSMVGVLRDRFISCCQSTVASANLRGLLTSNDKLLNISVSDISSINYAELIVRVSLLLLVGQTDSKQYIPVSSKQDAVSQHGSSLQNAISSDFLAKNSAVNASYCDFLECVVSEVQVKHDQFLPSMKVMLRSVLLYLVNLIAEENHVMQVQVLNVYGTLLSKISDAASSQSFSQVQKESLAQIFTSPICFPVLVRGLSHSKVYYLNQMFLKNINASVFYCASVVTQKSTNLAEKLSKSVSDIIRSYVELIRSTESPPLHISSQVHSQHLRDSSSLKSKCFLSKSDLSLIRKRPRSIVGLNNFEISFLNPGMATNTLPTSFQNQKTLFDELNALINFFLKFKKQEEESTIGGLLERSRLKSIFNMSSSGDRLEPQTAQFLQFETINLSILEQISTIIEALLHCWPLSVSFQKHISFSSKGFPRYNFEEFFQFSEAYQKERETERIHKEESLREQIISIMKPLFMKFRVDILHAMFKLYLQYVENDWYAQEAEVLDTYKLCDLIMSLEIPLEELIGVINRSELTLNIANFYNSRMTIPKNTFPFNRKIVINETNVLSFVYMLFSIYPICVKKMQDTKFIDIWSQANKFFQQFSTLCLPHCSLKSFLEDAFNVLQFKNTKHAQSLLWLIETIYMMTQKFSAHEALTERSFRKDLRRLCKGILQTLSQIAANKIQFTSVVPAAVDKSTSDHVRRYSLTNDFTLVAPASPVIFEMFQEKPDHPLFVLSDPMVNNGMSSVVAAAVAQFSASSCSSPQKEEKTSGDDTFIQQNSILCYSVLSKVSYDLLANIYNTNDRISKITQAFLIDLFKVIEKKGGQHQNTNPLYASLLIHSLLRSSGSILAKELRKNLIEIFNATDFFSCDIEILRYWKDIIDCVSDQGDLFKEFLTKDGLFYNLVSKTFEQGHKVKKLFRVCFIIFSGAVDKYSRKLLDVLEALNEVIQNSDDSNSPTLQILILFCFRVLLVRMSKATLSDQFRIVWPTILAFLMRILNQKPTTAGNPQAVIMYVNVVLAALKFIELLSILKLEEFYFYQWMFSFDYLGVKFEKVKLLKNSSSGSGRNRMVVTPFNYSPWLGDFFSEEFSLDYMNTLHEVDVQKTFSKEKRRIVIQESVIETEVQLQEKVIDLCSYLIDVNQKRFELDLDDVEAVIENDFIHLNQFILSHSQK